MVELVKTSVADGTAFLIVEHPHADGLSAGVRKALSEALQSALADDSVQDIVLVQSNAAFRGSARSDAKSRPTLNELCNLVETAPKPVISAIQGTVTGDGCALALAAHYRIAVQGARLGFPDTRFGVMPSGGATQRAPRLIGAEAALTLLQGHAPVSVNSASMSGMIDLVVDQPLVQAVVDFTGVLRPRQSGPRPTSERAEGFADYKGFMAAIKSRRAELTGSPELAPREVVDCVEAALLMPFEAGLSREDHAVEACRLSDQSKALAHLQLAEIACVSGAPCPVKAITVLGGGPLALWLVQKGLTSGLGVNWGVPDADIRKAGILTLSKAFGNNPEDARFERLRTGLPEDMVADASVVLVAVSAMMAVPVPEDAIRYKLYPDRIDRVGLRFTVKPARTRLVEVVAGAEASQEEIDLALSLVRKLSFVPVVVTSSGFTICDRLAAACYRAADALVDMGQSPYHIDTVLRDWGWSSPPFLMRDRRGLEGVAKLPRAKGAANWAQVPVKMQRSGAASGGGFYDFEPGQPARASVEVADAIDALRPEQPPLPATQIIRLVLGAMANEGARMLADQWTTRPSDVDIAAVYGLDFPRTRGGPMKAADQAGLLQLGKAMRALGHADAPFWTPHSSFADLIKNGRHLSDPLPS